ncbi:hypothetical protein ACTOB_008632 [Actinoplanes oblitus]|uniref:Uncharacterized protein n=1 Tax=Actinoplanes oblitus TaxID=3040509 RepID=A0ABY8WH86_9ACTN|nr:hypothetical protein [Actinoplanes oblitus]WIM96436.1 hypothetical protein ACTOB_008632 [Actinoplanes oblitus]
MSKPTAADGFFPVEALVSRLSATFSFEPSGTRAGAHAVQEGSGVYGVLAGADRVGDEPRLLIDFNQGRPLLTAHGQQVGERHGDIVRLWGQDYHLRSPRYRSWLRLRVRVEVTVAERPVLRAYEQSDPGRTVRTLRAESDPALDPMVALALLLLVTRPDKMGVLGELFKNAE